MKTTKEIIEELFNINAVNSEGLPKIIFTSDEKTANAVRLAVIIYSDFWNDIQMDFHNYPTVKTTIYCKSNASLDNFLELHGVYKAFENAL